MRSLVLASTSPRRRDLLAQAGLKFDICSVKISEILDKNLNLDPAISHIAWQKAMAALHSDTLANSKNNLILSADTLVVLDGETLGKPSSEAQAIDYLTRLSGRSHEVKTGFCLYDQLSSTTILQTETTLVEFKNLDNTLIRDYVNTGAPMDKAGGYGVQDLSGDFIKHIHGCRENVMGLPIHRVTYFLKTLGWNVDHSKKHI